MTTGDVCYSVSDYGKLFVRHYKNENLTQDEIDKIVVDFINYFAGRYCIDLAMDTKDLRTKHSLKNPYAVIDRDLVIKHLEFHKVSFKEIYCLENIVVIDFFIKGYYHSCLNTPAYIVDARKNKEKRRYEDREATIKYLLLSIVTSKYLAGDVKKDELDELILATSFVKLDEFYGTIEVVKDENRYRQSKYCKAHLNITRLEEKCQIEGLRKLILFFKQKGYYL